MNKQEFLNLKKGRFYKMEMTTQPKVYARFKDIGLTKITTTVGRVGIDYKNLKQTRIVHGIEANVFELPWGKWIEFPYLIENRGQTKARYIDKDGNSVDYKQAIEMLLKSSPQDAPLGIYTRTTKLENLKVR